MAVDVSESYRYNELCHALCQDRNLKVFFCVVSEHEDANVCVCVCVYIYIYETKRHFSQEFFSVVVYQLEISLRFIRVSS